MDEKAGPWAKSDAFKNFEANLEPLIGLIEPKIKRLEKVIRTAQEIVNDKISADTCPDIEVIRIAVDQIGEDVRAYVKETRFTVQWLCVMLVTFTTAYLEDRFVYLALKNSESMKEADPLPCHTIFKAETIDDLKSEMMHRWADKSIQAGPKSWFALLKKLGARDYKDDTQFLLTHLWDTRNRVVHGRGAADALYVKSYASLNLTLGDSIPLTNKTLKWWLEGLSHFTETTDRFFANYTGPMAA
ncbi:MAG: hypothetical protein ABJA83_14785 [Burkholderiaceae bacterium]